MPADGGSPDVTSLVVGIYRPGLLEGVARPEPLPEELILDDANGDMSVSSFLHGAVF